MLDKYLTKDQISSCARVGFVDAALEKSGGAILDTLKSLFSLGTGYANLFPYAIMLGASGGALGGIGYHTMKERLAAEDPREALQRKIEAIYRSKARELSDAKWMDRVRGMRDDLVRNYKKMSVDEYTDKYNALVAALDERKA